MLAGLALLGVGLQGSRQPQSIGAVPTHAAPAERLIIKNTMVIYGSGKPPFGPVDVLVQDGLVAQVGGWYQPRNGDVVIDGTGRYVMPGLINTHMHWHEWRVPSIPQPIQYQRNLYLASGVTTVRELGGNFLKSKRWQAESAAGRIVSPRVVAYARPNLSAHRGHPDEIRAAVRRAKQDGADGLKIGGLDRDQLEVLLDEARRQELPTAAHIGVEETTALDYIELGVDSIEHFYGIAEAALGGLQAFPAGMNYQDEAQRFARAGELFEQADPARLGAVLGAMVDGDVGWSPTLSVYEANRDLLRAQNLPWYEDYLHPSMEAFWQPNRSHHGSYFGAWTPTFEARWRRNFRLWMDALRAFGRLGGLITTGDDAGYIYSLYGFGLIRELELHEEAGFHPLEVVRHATWNGARLLGLDDQLGKIRVGHAADLLVINGNPLDNLRLLNPYGTGIEVDGVPTHSSGIEWTIKAGVPYYVPTLMREVRTLVANARDTYQHRMTAGAP